MKVDLLLGLNKYGKKQFKGQEINELINVIN